VNLTEAGGREGVARVDDGVRTPLDPRAITLDRIAGGIFSAIFSIALVGGAAVPVLVADLPGFVDASLMVAPAIVAALVAGFNYAWPAISHRHKSYTVNAASIEIRSGVVWRKVISVPRTRVQHTDVSQGPLERRFDLGTLVIYTAGTEHSKIDLRGLAHDRASMIRDHLLPVEESDAV
jgi:membrane protein YdbS with pleckstrin-like domain